MRSAWKGSPFAGPGDGEDEAVRLCQRGRDEAEIFGPDFERWASEVFGPMLQAEQKESR